MDEKFEKMSAFFNKRSTDYTTVHTGHVGGID